MAASSRAARGRSTFGDHIVGRVFSFDDVTDREQVGRALRESRDQLEAKVAARTARPGRGQCGATREQVRQEELIKKLAEAHTQFVAIGEDGLHWPVGGRRCHEINNPVGFVSSNIGSLQRYTNDLLRLVAAYERVEAELPGDGTCRHWRSEGRGGSLAICATMSGN